MKVPKVKCPLCGLNVDPARFEHAPYRLVGYELEFGGRGRMRLLPSTISRKVLETLREKLRLIPNQILQQLTYSLLSSVNWSPSPLNNFDVIPAHKWDSISVVEGGD